MENLKIENFNNKSYTLKGNFLIFPENGIPNKFLIEEKLKLLKKWGLLNQLVENLDILSENSPLIQENFYYKNTYENLLVKINSLFEKIKLQKSLDYKECTNLVQEIISFYEKDKDNFLDFLKFPQSTHKYLIVHTLNSIMLVVSLSFTMKLNINKTIELCLGALTHRIGFLFIKDEILDKKTSLSEEEFNTIKTYPVMSYKILARSNFPQKVQEVALSHKENYDGSGYPRKLKKEQIPTEAHIIGVVSAYVAINLKKVYKESLNPGAALIEIIKEIDLKFDKRIVSLITNTLSIYPLNSIIELKNGDLAKVIKINKENINEPFITKIVEKNTFLSNSVRSIIIANKENDAEIEKLLSEQEINKFREKLMIRNLE